MFPFEFKFVLENLGIKATLPMSYGDPIILEYYGPPVIPAVVRKEVEPVKKISRDIPVVKSNPKKKATKKR